MPDFHQPILLPTLHHLADTRLEEREELLEQLAKERPIALVIPALYAELEREALPHILKQLEKVRYIDRIIFSMNGMNADQWSKSQVFFDKHLSHTHHEVLWNDGPQLQDLHHEVNQKLGLNHHHGKGSNVWMGVMSLLSSGHQGAIACHDSDILNYDREMLWRLLLPVVHPKMDYVFAKSFYGRVREKMYGRVTRLLVFPLLQALREVFGSTPLLRFLAMCRYPLSGEFAASSSFLGKINLSSGWGLEIGMLCEVFRHAPSERFCQVDLGSNFEHKHQHLLYTEDSKKADPTSGLLQMAQEVTRALLAHLWTDLGFSAETRKLHRLAETYTSIAQILLSRYSHEAYFNGLDQAVEEELETVRVFGEMISQVANDCTIAPPTIRTLPSWLELQELQPDFREKLR